MGVPARGWHGEACRGHVFWDELFIFPFLNLRAPELTRSLLRYRYRRLPEARHGARKAGFEGAMYPWQSGSDGREESQVLHLNPRSGRWIPDHTDLQVHINAAVPYNVCHYYRATEDAEFLSQFGAEMMLAWDRYREEHGAEMRLDRILEAEGDTPDRYQATKQADVLMLFYLLSAGELAESFERLGYDWDPAAIPDNVEYYVKRTAHGSTLSGVVHSWVLSRLDRERSWGFFCDALRSDVEDVQGGTTPEGIHLGAMAGTVDLLRRCYTGLEIRREGLWFNPLLPEELERLDTRIQFRDQTLDVTVVSERLEVAAAPDGAGPTTIGYRGETVRLHPGDRHVFSLSAPA